MSSCPKLLSGNLKTFINCAFSSLPDKNKFQDAVICIDLIRVCSFYEDRLEIITFVTKASSGMLHLLTRLSEVDLNSFFCCFEVVALYIAKVALELRFSCFCFSSAYRPLALDSA